MNHTHKKITLCQRVQRGKLSEAYSIKKMMISKRNQGSKIENVETVGCNFMKGSDRRNSEKVAH